MSNNNYIELIRAGDRGAFRLFMDDNIDSIYRLVFRTIADEDEARDIVQETFIKVWEKRESLKKESSILNWTRRIAINRCYDYFRALKRRGDIQSRNSNYDFRNIISDDQADDNLSGEEYSQILNSIIATLSPKQNIVFSLSVIEDMSPDEIEKITGMTKSSIKSNLYHARIVVKEKLELILDYE